LAKALKRSDGSKGGRPPFPAVLMFKIRVLQALYNLSDDQAALRLSGGDAVSDGCELRHQPIEQ